MISHTLSRILILSGVLLLAATGSVQALSMKNDMYTQPNASDSPNYYGQKQQLEWKRKAAGTVPTVAELELPAGTTGGKLLITNENGAAQPFVFTVARTQPQYSVLREGMLLSMLNDRSAQTGMDFPVADTASPVRTVLTLRFQEPMAVDGLEFEFDALSRTPQTVMVVAEPQSSQERIIANTTAYQKILRFPSQVVTELEVTLIHSQPLRMTRLSPLNTSAAEEGSEQIRFLAQPTGVYTLYTQRAPLAPSPMPLEAGDLFGRPVGAELRAAAAQQNENFAPLDRGSDSISDSEDNCPTTSNVDQTDLDMNGVGDACQDFDFDGVLNVNDNCPERANRSQTDTDADGVGDECDGAESRLTEQKPWLPWAALGFTGVIIAGLFATALKSTTWKTK